jgi:hypothetical protein
MLKKTVLISHGRVCPFLVYFSMNHSEKSIAIDKNSRRRDTKGNLTVLQLCFSAADRKVNIPCEKPMCKKEKGSISVVGLHE